MSIGTEVKDVAEKVLHAAEWPFKSAAELEAFIATAIKEEGPARTVVVGLIQQVKTVVFDGSKDIAEKGLSLPDDMQTITDLKSLAAYFNGTFLPEAEKVWSELKTDAGEASTAPASSAPATSAATPSAETVSHVATETGAGLAAA
jgi:hypothetical protein